MRNRNRIYIAALAAVFVCGCGESTKWDGRPQTCTEDRCADDSHLDYCIDGTVHRLTCPKGCANNACVEDRCTSNACLDDRYLSVCNPNTGKMSPLFCPFGCGNSRCLANTSGDPEITCSVTGCKDDVTLAICQGGKQTEKPCPYGCKVDACLPACTTSYCVNDATLASCDAGRTTEVACPYGCESGRNECRASCTTSFCRDANILVKCSEEGKAIPEECADGCDASKGACRVQVPECTANAAPRCDATGRYVMTCVDGHWTNAASACANGCAGGVCRDKCIEGSGECRDGKAFHCVNGSLTPESCADGCETFANSVNGVSVTSARCIKTSTGPTVGAACTKGTRGVCTDGTMYSCDADASGNYTWQAVSCASEQMACATFGDGSSSCVFKSVCNAAAQGDVLPIGCTSGILLYADCQKDADGKLVGVMGAAQTICYSHEGKPYEIGCSAQESQPKVLQACETCSFDATTFKAKCQGGSTTKCDVYDCSSQYAQQCNSELGMSGLSAMCNKTNAFCVLRNAAGDAACTSGQAYTNYYIDEAGTPKESNICVTVGADASCLGGSTGNDTLYDCTSEKANETTTLGESCVNQFGADKTAALCVPCTSTYWCTTPADAQANVGKSASSVMGEDVCAALVEPDIPANSCSANGVKQSDISFDTPCGDHLGCQGTVCAPEKGKDGKTYYYVDFLQCKSFSDGNFWSPVSPVYKVCDGTCNAEGSNCDGDGQLLEYQF